MATLLVIRHGETEWNNAHRIQGGGSDVPLSAEGRRQALALALRLATTDIEAIYSSPLSRALETARLVAWPHNLEVVQEPRLREISAGNLEGVTNSELGMTLATYLIHDAGEDLVRPPEGESLLDLKQRVWPAFTDLATVHGDGVVAVVCHYFVTLVMVCTVLGLPLKQLDRLRLGTAGITVVHIDEDRMFLEALNDRGHLGVVGKGF